MPALAASTAAFKASIFVWKAISSIVLIIASICEENSLICCIEYNTSFIFLSLISICCPTEIACWFAFSALCALTSTWCETSLREAASCSTALACSVAPCAKESALSAICIEFSNTLLDDFETCPNVCVKFVLISKRESLILENSPV